MTETNDLIAGRYRLLAQVGTGGMGVVWRARDEVLGRTVALKELMVRSTTGGAGLGDEGTRRAMREARIAARLHHPNVIGVYDIVDHDGRPFLVMEYLESRSLAQLMAAGVLLPPHEVARIGAQLASALTAAHNAGIVHRDVKPGNVLLAEDGEVKLTDFGISRAVGDTTVTASGLLLGTLGYIAPEVAQGQPADSLSDVYSLGATLYAAVEGQPPFGNTENAVAQLYRIIHEEIIPARHAGPLEPVLLWMLSRDPTLRPAMPHAERALKALETAPEDAVPAEPEPEQPAAARTTPLVAAAPIPADRPYADSPAPTPPPAVPAAASSEPAPRKRFALGTRRRAVIAVLIAALLLALGGWGLSVALGGHSTTAKAGASTPTSHAAASTAAAPSASSRPSNPSGSKSSASPSASATAASAPAQSRADQLTSTIIAYYHLVPGNLSQAWPWMTPDYQQNHAGGWSGYQSFWSKIQRVTVSDVTATLPSTVTATIDYYYKDGSFAKERTQFGLLFDQGRGRWLIASSSVLG
ncbi:MAG TPA: serine/threonine-protein kinase [Actinocrinis sp.]|uniref:serine/threonine-protein kinase n=1 Tax=Actinocrinis sp. TaxID=1920516 RepID=UPI002D545D15|nr:serine/threonine-protein kinase [Actinocrinis sp.]HZU56240.1 serine/threonine-protein kinase [Actinocrinis sp.]